MGKIRLVEKGTAVTGKLDLPAFYMNDFSVMGIVVNGLEQASGILRDSGFTLVEDSDITWVRFEHGEEMQRMVDELQKQEVPCMLTDLMSCAYQG